QAGADEPGAGELKEFLAPHFAKWWLPEYYLLVDELPKTGVGKINKKLLREQAQQLIAERE
ncbi:MAG: hypothetical protein VW985_03200, partial [Gammaproteobacteria bacterium]